MISAPSASSSIIKRIREYFPISNITCCDMQLYTEFIPDIEEYRGYLLQHWNDFNQLSDDLVDECSRATLESVLKGRITGNIAYYRKCYSSEPYYPCDIFSFASEEVMVELGGYDGATLLRFIELCPSFRVAYCFEPDADLLPRLYEIQKEQFQEGKNIIIVNKGAWDKTGKIKFAKDIINRDRGSLMLDNIGNDCVEVEVTTVDEAVKDKISFMKLDIEGAEIKALHGAEKQIQNNKPKLAVCIYHKPEDILEIWKYLKSLVPEYRFYLRHHNQNSGTDTIMYAIVEKEIMTL